MKERRRWHKIPIYGAHFEVVLTDDIQKSHDCRKYLPKFKIQEPTHGMSSYCGSIFVVFLKRDRGGPTHSTVSHEVFHAAARILESCDIRLDPDHHEPYAYLIGHLSYLTHKCLHDWGVKL